jgi:glycolate oxidase iron-sulfur subunit
MADHQTGIFDAEHPPSPELIRECVHCGFCLQACPTYALWNEEMDSPRGRIYLMKLGTEGAANMDAAYVRHFDQCLGCVACMPACPSGVQYGKLIEATRAQIERNYRRPLLDRLHRGLIFSLFPRPGRLRLLAPLVRSYQALGLGRLARRAGLLGLLPERLRALEELMPPAPRGDAPLPERTEAVGERRLRVGLVLGCVQRVFFPHVNHATARVLAAEGCEVVAPPAQGCCGALFLHGGREREAREHARRLIDAFEAAGVDVVAINAAGCGSAIKEYDYLLRDDREYAEKARAFSAKCKDVSEVLAGLEPRATRHPLRLRVAYHGACHLQHAQRVVLEPRSVLAGIPGVEAMEVAEPALCCGSAGVYNLVEPVPARALGDRKAANALATAADVIVTGNPGCQLQLAAALRRAGSDLRVMHLVELLDASIRGELPRMNTDTHR